MRVMHKVFDKLRRRWEELFPDAPNHDSTNYDTTNHGSSNHDSRKPEDAAPERPVNRTEARPETSPRAAEADAGLDPRAELEADCYKTGFQVARKSWELEPNEQTRQALETKATAMGLARYLPPSETEEERKAKSYEKLEAELKKREAGRDRARAVAQSARRVLAALGPAQPRPAISALLRHAATLGLTISIAPTLHDLAIGLDPFLKWLVGGLSAWGLSLLVVHGLLPNNAEPGELAGAER